MYTHGAYHLQQAGVQSHSAVCDGGHIDYRTCSLACQSLWRYRVSARLHGTEYSGSENE
jgi:hypothetical protein